MNIWLENFESGLQLNLYLGLALSLSLFFFFAVPHHIQDLVALPGIELVPPAAEVQTSNH